VILDVVFDQNWHVRKLLLQMLRNGFLNLETLSQRVKLMNTHVFVAMTSDVSRDEILPDIIATFKIIGESDSVAALNTSAVGCVFEFLCLLRSSECATEAEEALAMYVIE
jgi:hypothetical protein